MRYTLSMGEHHARPLRDAIFSVPGCEGAAYLLCGISVTDEETRLLVRDVVPVADADYLRREPLRLSIDSTSYARAVKQAKAMNASIVFVHCHPDGIPEFSAQDDLEEPKLMAFFSERLPARLHGSLVVSGESEMSGRVWVKNEWRRMSRVRVVGDRLRFIDRDSVTTAHWFDRQIRAFGDELQALMSQLHIGIVGCGGTGSPVAEMLCRLGVGRLSLFDGDALEDTNVTRVWGSTLRDSGENKALVLATHLEHIGMGTKISVFDRYISEQAVAAKLRDCDVVFGCTDAQHPRGLLGQLALRYLIPVFDVGVKISASEGRITGIDGRVTTLLPGSACLFCRERINAEAIRLEQLSAVERAERVREGYAPELPGNAPAVVTFTTGIAVQAVNEFLHRLSGFMGDRTSTEVLVRFHVGRSGTTSTPPVGDCQCSNTSIWGRGDSPTFLDVSWTS